MSVCGTGSRGVIVTKMEPHKGVKIVLNSHVSRSGRMVFKVMTDSCIHYREIAQASFLTHLDPHQQYFVYAVATYTMKGDRELLESLDRQNRVPGKKFDVDAAKIYVDIMPYGGRSLYALTENSDTKLTVHQAATAINNLVEGLAVLHRNDMIHGDVHEHNVVIDVAPNGAISARWIDFSEVKGVDPENMMRMQTDVKRLIRVIKMIVGLVSGSRENSEQLDNMAYEIGRGSAPMTAMGLQSVINEHMKPTNAVAKRARSSSSKSKSGSRSSGPIVKRLAF